MALPEYPTWQNESLLLRPGPTITLLAATQSTLPARDFTPQQLQSLNSISTFNGAAALTCYTPDTATPLDFLTQGPDYQKQSLRVAAGTRKAGHHSTIEHVNYTFLLKDVSRLAIWQVLHSHQHLVSDQQSQRYVTMSQEGLVYPRLDNSPADQIYLQTAQDLFSGYQQLNQLLRPSVESHYQQRFGQTNSSAVDKLTQEISRYLLPMSMGANLWHSVNSLTLIRYHNLSQTYPLGHEAQVLIQGMVETVCQYDPGFRDYLGKPLPPDSPEVLAQKKIGPPNSQNVSQYLNQQLDNTNVRLDTTQLPPSQTLAQAVRLRLGYTPQQLSDEQAVSFLLDPTQNPYLASIDGETVLDQFSQILNQTQVSALVRLSLSADAQLQRHRGFNHTAQKDIPLPTTETGFYIPPIVQENPQALDLYLDLSQKAALARSRLLDLGVSPSLTQYLATNNTLTYKQISAPLGSLYHFASVRSCYRAQEEIWRLNLDLLRQLQTWDPLLGTYFDRPTPCGIRRLANITPFCPEAKHQWCGLPSWKHSLSTLPDRRI